MKKIYGLLFFISLAAFGALLQMQTLYVSITAGTFTTKSDSCNRYYGINVTLDQSYDQDIAVCGSAYSPGRAYADSFSITVPAGKQRAETRQNYVVLLDTSVFTEIFSITPSTVTKDGVPY
ncbi:MAG: hypothetical protein ICV84_00595, partial [Flavisolibacter sp.]|nr:hypothetical protein [Flavisolibacter sp.]